MRERPARTEDLAAVVDLWRRYETATSGAPETSEAEVLRDWRGPSADLEQRTRVLEDAGTLVGYAVVDGHGGCDSVVDPGRPGEGLEDRLLAFLEETPGPLQHYWGSGDDAAADRFGRRGWTATRTFARLRRELDGTVPEPRWPAGTSVRDLEPDRDVGAAHALITRAFADIGDPRGTADLPSWRSGVLAQAVPRWCPVVEQGGTLVAAAVVEPLEADGFVRQLAVARGARRQGLGRAVLEEVFRRCAADGCGAVVLGVDTANPTGALALYEQAGMHLVESFTRWERG